MSPDPPRTDTHDDDELVSNNNVVYFMPLSDDDEDLMADGNQVIHQLDYNTQDESDFSDDYEDALDGSGQQGSHNPENDNGSTESAAAIDNGDEPVTTTRMMAHYTLLIPFPPSEIIESPESAQGTTDDEDHEGAGSPACSNNTAEVPTSVEVSTTESNNTSGNKKSDEMIKREIHLSEDNVELIKNAMKGFSLPPTSIPTWAEQLDEASWKEKLVTTIEKKSVEPHAVLKGGDAIAKY